MQVLPTWLRFWRDGEWGLKDGRTWSSGGLRIHTTSPRPSPEALGRATNNSNVSPAQVAASLARRRMGIEGRPDLVFGRIENPHHVPTSPRPSPEALGRATKRRATNDS